jgi:hypothetical protein
MLHTMTISRIDAVGSNHFAAFITGPHDINHLWWLSVGPTASSSYVLTPSKSAYLLALWLV